MTATSSVETSTAYRDDPAHVFHSWSAQALLDPVVVAGASGSRFWDEHGNSWLDFSSQLVNVNIGHQHPKVVAAIKEQADLICTISPAHVNAARSEAARLITERTPSGLDHVFFTNGGADANEHAIRMARLHTGKHKVLARYASYHCSTSGTIGLTGDWRRWLHEPAGVVPGILHGPEANCYRCPLGKEHPDCAMACVEYLAYMIDREQNVAAVIVEPIVGTNGVLIPPAEYLPRLAEICKQRGVLLIVDEVMTGFGRTGRWFALDHWGGRPAMVTFAKAVTSAYLPLGGVMVSRAIHDDIRTAPAAERFMHAATYSPRLCPISAAGCTPHP